MSSETSALGVQNIKIPLLIKIYGFFIFLITLINFLSLDFVYAFHGIGKYFFIFLAVAILWLGYSFSVYKYIKKPTIGIGRLHIFVLILMFLGNIASLIGGFLNFGVLALILIIPLIIKLFLITRFSKINKILKNPENFSDEKSYSEKSQEKGLIKTFGIFFIGLIIFYFTYYTTPPIEFKRIPDSYFDDSELYKNVDSEENGYKYIDIRNFIPYDNEGHIFHSNLESYKNVEKRINLENYLYLKYLGKKEKIKIILKYDYNPSVRKNYFEFDNKKFYYNEKYSTFLDKKLYPAISDFYYGKDEKIKKIDINKEILINFENNIKKLEKLYKSKYYTSTYNNKIQKGFYTKNNIYLILYYLDKGKNNKAFTFLLNDYNLSKIMLSGYTDFVTRFHAYTNLQNSIFSINYIIDEYNFNKNELIFLKKEILRNKNIIFNKKNSNIYEYNNLIFNLKNYKPTDFFYIPHYNESKIKTYLNLHIKNALQNFKPLNINYNLYLSKNYLKEINKNIYFYASKKTENKKIKFCKENFFKKSGYLKKDGLTTIEGLNKCYYYIKYYNEDFQKIQKQEIELLEKIDRKIKEAEKSEKNKKENGKKEEKTNKKVLEFFKKK